MTPRSLLALLMALLALGLVAGCGGDDGGGGDQADSGTDVDQLLEETFTGKKQIDSGKLDLALALSSSDGDGRFDISGPFQTTGKGKVPLLDIEASFEGGGESFSGGVTTTEDRGFVTLQGTAYEISGPIWQQLKAGYEETASKQQDESQSLATLGIDPRKWLTDAKNEGEAKVGDADTIKITGGVDVPKMLDDFNAALEKIRSLGGASAADLPEQITPEQKQQVRDAVKDLNVEIYTGADDKILRRLVVDGSFEVDSGGSTTSADAKLDFQLLDLNEDQEIAAPSDARPFEDLASQLDELGLGNLGLGGGGGQGGGGGGGGASQENLEKYSECIQDAGGDNAKIRECADLLTP